MGILKDALKNWFYTNNSQAADANALIPLIAGAASSGVAAGDPIGSDTLKNIMLKQRVTLSTNVGVAVDNRSGSGAKIKLLKLSEYNRSSHTVVGIWISEGGETRIFERDYSYYGPFSSASPSESLSPVTDLTVALSEFNGKALTSQIDSLMGTDAAAVQYCKNKTTGGLNWFLPSLAELFMVYKHYYDYCFVESAITGGSSDIINLYKDLLLISSTIGPQNQVYALSLDGNTLNPIDYNTQGYVWSCAKIEDSNI